MIAFDNDVATEILNGSPTFVQRASTIPLADQAVPIIVVEETMRGRLNVIRQAEAGKAKISIERAYELFQRTFLDFQRLNVLAYSAAAESLFRQWRSQRIRCPTHDLRIAAICVASSAKLISRNRRDFEKVPGLVVEFWD